MSKDNSKDWEKPWSTEEIVEHADNWNLACDAALLNTLKAFGDRILKKAEDVNDKIENLNENLGKVHLRVDLARNEFSSLRNTQFIECRVYEEDETLITEKLKDEENNVPEEETIEDFREAVALGLEILDEYYDKVTVTVSDSEGEDEDEPSYVYRRRDPYINRRLPLLIGSEEWHKKWHVGLEETDSENENSLEKISDSESEENFSQKEDRSDASSELSDLSGLNSSKTGPAAESTTIVKRDYPASTRESDLSAEPAQKTLSFAEQLAAKLGNVIKEKRELLEEPEVNKRPIQKKPSDYGALFSNEPPPLDDVKVPETHGIFSGGQGLFDDEDEDDLWNPAKPGKSPGEQYNNPAPKQPLVSNIEQAKGLFDDDSDDGIFTKKSSITQQIKQPYLQPNKPVIPVFDEEPPLFDEDTKEKKKPTGGVSLFGKSDIIQGQSIGSILKQRKISSSEDSTEEEHPKGDIKKTNEVSKPILQNRNSNKQTISSVPKNEEREKKKSVLFDDDIFNEDLFSSKKSSTGLFEKSSLFSDEEFLPTEKTSKTTEKLERTKVIPSKSSDIENSLRKKSMGNISSLFDDNDEDHIFESKNYKNDEKTTKKNPKEKENTDKVVETKKITTLGLFDDLDDVDDLFSGISKKNDDKTKKSISFLFDDNADDDYDIFATKKEKKILGEENLRDKTEGDLFSDNLVKKKNDIPPRQSLKTKEFDEINKKTKSKISLFDDQEEKKFQNNTKINTSNDQNKTNSSTEPKISLDQEEKDTISKEDNKKSTKDEKTKEKNEPPKKLKPEIRLFEEGPNSDKNIPNENIESTKNGETKEEATANRKLNLTVGLFEDEDETVVPHESSKNEEPKRKKGKTTNKKIKPTFGLFDEEDITTKVETVEAKKKTKTEKPKTKKEEATNKNIKLTLGLFDDEDITSEGETVETHTEIEEPKTKKEEATNKTKPFEDETVETKESAKIEETKKEGPNISTKPNFSLFDDDLEDMDELFSEFTKKKDEKEISSISSSLFTENSDKEPEKSENCTKTENKEKVLKDLIKPVTAEKPIIKNYPSEGLESQKKELKTEIGNTPIKSNENSGKNVETIQENKETKTSSVVNLKPYDSVFNVNFMDSTPPPDDDWDTYSDTFDDIEQVNDGYQSQQSSLFDNEPPSLFFNDTATFKDTEINFSKDDKKIDVLSVFLNENKTNPYLTNLDNKEITSVSTDIKINEKTEDSEPTNKETDKTKNIKTKPPILAEKPKKAVKFAEPHEEIIKEKKQSLFGDVPGQDQTDFLFSDQSEKDTEIRKIIEDKSGEKINSASDQSGANEPVLDRQSGDNMQKNISKITEKLQQISNKKEVGTKPIVVPRKISHNLNINVGALLPGSALPKRERNQDSNVTESLSKSLPSSRFNSKDEVSEEPTKPISFSRASSEDSHDKKEFSWEKSVSFDGGTDTEVLRSMTKDRARIPVKRRPSSRRARQKSLRDSLSDFRLDDPIVDEVSMPENENSVEKNRNSEDDLFKNIEKDVKNVNEAQVISTKKKETVDKELFKKVNITARKNNDLFQVDDLFESCGNTTNKKEETIHDKNSKLTSDNQKEKLTNKTEHKPKVEKKSTIDSLFDSSDDDDIFKSTNAASKQPKNVEESKKTEVSNISIIGKMAETPKKKSENLFDSSDDEDFLSNFTSKKDDNKKGDKKFAVKRQSNLLFDDGDDEDIFGTGSAANKTQQDMKPSVINKKTPKSSNLHKLENLDGDEDPLSALLK